MRDVSDTSYCRLCADGARIERARRHADTEAPLYELFNLLLAIQIDQIDGESSRRCVRLHMEFQSPSPKRETSGQASPLLRLELVFATSRQVASAVLRVKFLICNRKRPDPAGLRRRFRGSHFSGMGSSNQLRPSGLPSCSFRLGPGCLERAAGLLLL